jgi:hypothetical protein
MQNLLALYVSNQFAGKAFYGFKDSAVLIFTETLVHTAKTHMAQVFQPLEIRNRNTTCISQNIWNY